MTAGPWPRPPLARGYCHIAGEGGQHQQQSAEAAAVVSTSVSAPRQCRARPEAPDRSLSVRDSNARRAHGAARSYGTRQGVAGNEKDHLVEMSTCLRTHGEPLAVTQGVCTPEPTNDSSRCPPFPRRGIGRWTMILYLGRGLGSQECHCRKFNGITLRHNVCTRGARTLR